MNNFRAFKTYQKYTFLNSLYILKINYYQKRVTIKDVNMNKEKQRFLQTKKETHGKRR